MPERYVELNYIIVPVAGRTKNTVLLKHVCMNGKKQFDVGSPYFECMN